MKIKIFDAPTYLHSTGGGSIHLDIEHPLFGKIMGQGERTLCQGKGDHGVFITLDPGMTQRAANLMRMRTTSFQGTTGLLTTQVAEVLDEIADLLEVIGDEYRPIAYRRAARNLERSQVDIIGLVKSGELTLIHGVGESIAAIIREYIETGEIGYLEDLQGQVPVFSDLLELPYMDVRTAKLIHEKLGVSNIDDLSTVVREGRLHLGPQPTTLEDSIKLKVFSHWSGMYSKVLTALFEDLSSIESLRRRFGPESIIYEASIEGALRQLFTVYPRGENGIEVLITNTADGSSLLEELSGLPGEVTLEKGGIRLCLRDVKGSSQFSTIIRKRIEEDGSW